MRKQEELLLFLQYKQAKLCDKKKQNGESHYVKQ